MSLVNDALKRAKESQSKNTPSSDTRRYGRPPLKTVGIAPRSANEANMLAALVLVILILAGLWFGQWLQGDTPMQVRANSIPVANQAVTQPAKDAAAADTSNKGGAATSGDAVSTELSPESSKPLLAPYRLQSVLYLPKNPSAVINGKVVSVNGVVEGARVVNIGPGTATLVTPGGQTNVLAIR